MNPIRLWFCGYQYGLVIYYCFDLCMWVRLKLLILCCLYLACACRWVSASSRRLEEDPWRYEQQSKKTGGGIRSHMHHEEGLPANFSLLGSLKEKVRRKRNKTQIRHCAWLLFEFNPWTVSELTYRCSARVTVKCPWEISCCHISQYILQHEAIRNLRPPLRIVLPPGENNGPDITAKCAIKKFIDSSKSVQTFLRNIGDKKRTNGQMWKQPFPSAEVGLMLEFAMWVIICMAHVWNAGLVLETCCFCFAFV